MAAVTTLANASVPARVVTTDHSLMGDFYTQGIAAAEIKAQPEMASIRTINVAVLAGEIRKLATAIHTEAASTQSDVIADWAARLEATCEAHVHDAHSDDNAVQAFRAKLLALRERARRFAFEMDFSFLMRQERKLLSIGYRVEEHQLDESAYDLLASEARLTSLFRRMWKE